MDLKETRVLPSSESIRCEVLKTFDKVSKTSRKVVCVAYIGNGYKRFIRDPKGIEFYCDLKPGATSPDSLEDIQKRGGKLFSVKNLHMKVYWVERRGCIISSSNLSNNGLGSGLLEAGVFLDDRLVDINSLIPPKDKCEVVTKAMIADLREKTKNITPIFHDYLEWFDAPSKVREEWKLGWWNILSKIASPEARKETQQSSGGKRKNPYISLNIKKGQLERGDWVLHFNPEKLDKIKWMRVDYICSDRQGGDYPYQAIQIFPNNHKGSAPFHITKRFTQTFKKIVEKYETEIEETENLDPAKCGSLLQDIAHSMLS